MVIQGIYKEINQNKELHTMVNYWTFIQNHQITFVCYWFYNINCKQLERKNRLFIQSWEKNRKGEKGGKSRNKKEKKVSHGFTRFIK